MRDHFHFKTWQFLFWWVAGSVFVWPLGLVTSALGLMVFVMVIGFFADVFYVGDLPASLSSLLENILIALTLGGLIGWSVGVIQKNLLRKYLYWTADGWQSWSTLGGLVGSLALLIVTYAMPSNVNTITAIEQPLLIAMPLYVLCLSAVQMVSLSHATRWPGLWVFGNVMAGLAFSGLIFVNGPSLAATWSLEDGSSFLWLAALGVLTQGAMTGLVMLHLFEHHAYLPESPDEREREDAPPARPASIWDQAI